MEKCSAKTETNRDHDKQITKLKLYNGRCNPTVIKKKAEEEKGDSGLVLETESY